jgi:ATP-binding cassette subfamily B protein
MDGQMTLGMMLSVQYMIGQLNGPLEHLVSFVQEAQSAKISLERLNEIHSKDNEENVEEKLTILPENGDLRFENVSFRYGGPFTNPVLQDLNFTIPQGKTTAIVGTSGSGKTTILKLLLNSYQATEGTVKIGDVSLTNILNRIWRSNVGVVTQDGFIFSDTIAKNISVGEDRIDKSKLLYAVKIANIQSFVEGLPLGYNTKIGENGMGLSQGQKQRLLIARAVYKNPSYIFLDEATNALDAYNEMVIMDNLNMFLKGRTVVIVAHRLSTVKSADNIIVLEQGHIIEQGNHTTLTAAKGSYYHLVKNQLELGS